MYADDVSILSTNKDRIVAQRQAQEAVDIVVNWSKDWKLNLNGSKSEVSFFSNKGNDKRWTPTITIGGQAIRYEETPRLLGVILDRKLVFADQVNSVIARVTQKSSMLRAVANSTWGWRKNDLRKVFLSHIHSIMNFAGISWQSWLSGAQIKRLQVAQNPCLRIITTTAAGAPVPALHYETSIPTVAQTIQMNCLKSFEKAVRMDLEHPRFIAATSSSSFRLKSLRGFTEAARDLYLKKPHLDSYGRAPLCLSSVPLWRRGIKPNIVFPNLHGIKGRGDSAEEIRLAALKRSREINAVYNIYTDGYASAGTSYGGAGVVITTGDPSCPTVVDSIETQGALFTCSYEEEKRALEMAIVWIQNHPECVNQTIAIFTDSQSLCMALLGSSPYLDRIRQTINTVNSHLIIQWIPGHCDIPGNELADTTAKSAAKLPGPIHCRPPVSYGSSCAQITLCFSKDPPGTHERTTEVYGALSKERESQIKIRRDQSILAKLRSGHYVGLREYQYRIGGAPDVICPLCGEEDQDLVHWMTQCPALVARRWELFGSDSGRLDCLTRHPLEVLTLARETLGSP